MTETPMDLGSSGIAPGMFTPQPARAGTAALLAAQLRMELRLTLRRGESLLLTMVIPVLILVGITLTHVVELHTGNRVGFLAPGVLGLAVMSTAFTGQAIATGFERSYGVLKRLGASPLPRWGLMLAKTAGVVVVILVQLALLVIVGVLLGWRPDPAGIPASVLLVVLGTTAFSGLGLLMAGTLRAEATLAAANLIYLLLLAAGGVMFPLPHALKQILFVLPINSLVEGLRSALSGDGVAVHCWVVLVIWAVAAVTAAARWFRWE